MLPRPTVKNVVKLATGESDGHYEVEPRDHDAEGASLQVPHLFLITSRSSISALAAARRAAALPRDGHLIVWFYELWRADKSFDDAFAEVCDKARAETAAPMFHGKPEGGS